METLVKQEEVEVVPQRFRQLTGVENMIWKGVLISIPVIGVMFILSVHQMLNISLFSQQYIGLFLALVFIGVFMGVPARKNTNLSTIPWYDWILVILGATVGLYIAIFYPQLSIEMGYSSPIKTIMSVSAVIILLEALRRLTGWILLGIVVLFIFYAMTATYFPGVFQGRTINTAHLFSYMYLDANSLLNMLNIAATVALGFILLGYILLNFRGGEIFNDTALSLFGKYKGGAAKASIVGSGMVGSVTGGPVANVMLTGTMTIPLMKRSGFSKVQAGAIESVASTGGSFMPPLMGITAFLIAENLGVPYKEVALAALIPALLYYLSFFIQVHLIADKGNFLGIKKDELPKFKNVVKKIAYLVPIFVIFIYFLFFKGLSPDVSAVYGVGTAIVFLSLQKDVRKGFFHRIKNTLEDTGRVLLEIAVILGAAGLIIGVVGVTGLGYNLVLALSSLGSSSGLFILLIACAIVSIILGMGMPGLAAYALVAVLVAPTIIEFGVYPMAAHLFVFYFAMVSSFTPPIALACFAAAPIAGASPHKIGIEASKLGIVAYIVPFLFIYTPSLLLTPDLSAGVLLTTVSVLKAVIALSILAISVVGFYKKNLNIINRLILMVMAIIMLFPAKYFLMIIITIGLGSILLFVNHMFSKNKQNAKAI